MSECKYKTRNVLRLLHRRQLGLPVKKRGSGVRNSRNNYQSDFEILKTLLCDCKLHLEVIACRKISRPAEPSFCHNRLFTNNYRSWFNLCTSPTSGPCLMKTNVFSGEMYQNFSVTESPKIVDAVTVNPPNGCQPLMNSQHLPCILLLSKNGWLYQFCLKDAVLLNKVYIPTNVFANEINELGCTDSFLVPTDLRASQHNISRMHFRYQYITINGAEGRVLIQSCAYMHDGFTYVAYALLALFPLRVVSHFVTRATSSNLKAELWTNIFVLTAVKGSTVSLYGFEDIEKLHHIDSSHIQLENKLQRKDLLGGSYTTTVGVADIGIPYTTLPINLERWQEWKRFQLFRTKAIKHILRVGGVPYHFAVPINNNFTSWSLRSLADCKEIAKFHVAEKWDQSHISGVDFHSDESGRILVVDKGSVIMYKIEEDRNILKRLSCPDYPPQSSPESSQRSCQKIRKFDPVKLITTSPIDEPDSQLRVVDSVFGKITSKKIRTKSKCKIVKCFEIDIASCCIGKDKSSMNSEVKWRYPSQEATPSTTQSSYGRTLRQTRRYFGGRESNPMDTCVLGVSYEDELDVMAILHFQAPTDQTENYTTIGRYFDLVVSLYDNKTGARLNTVTVEQDLLASDCSEVSVILDEDTIIYTRIEYNDVLNYKIMRFSRKY